MWLLDSTGNQLKRKILFQSTLCCYCSFFKPIPEPSEHNPMPSTLGWSCWSRNVGPNALLWSLPACPTLGFCGSVMQNWDLIPSQGMGREQLNMTGGFWSSTEVQEKLNVEFWRGTDGGLQQQSVVVIKYYSFYKKKFTFLIWICNLKSLCDFGFLNWMLTSGFLFLPALLVILHMDKGESSPSSVCLDPSLSSRHPAHPVQPATFLCSRNLQLLALQVPCKPKNGSWANPVQL